MQNHRLKYFDALRGVAIILVVFSHFVVYDISFSKPSLINHINNFFLSFRMPLFFFISGFFVYSSKYNLHLLKKRCFNRICSQIYPTIILGSICCVCFFNSDFSFLYTREAKLGFWFTIVVAEMFFIVVPLLMLLGSNTWFAKQKHSLTICIYSIVIILVVKTIKIFSPISIVNLFGLNYILCYFIYFVIGILFRVNYNNLISFITNKYLAITCFFTYFVFMFYINFSFVSFIKAILAIIFIHFIAYKAFNYKRILEHIISKALINIGTMTLEIYLLHTFIIYYFKGMAWPDWIDNWKDSPFLFLFCFFISIVISVICIIISNFMEMIKIKNIIFPKKKSSIYQNEQKKNFY